MINPIFAGVMGLGGAELMIIIVILGVLFVFTAIPAVLAYLVLSRIPPQFRKQEPGMAFLLLIPFFAVVWNFFVHPKIAESLKAYFDSQGTHPNGDCGGSLALWLCICGAASFVPFLGFVAAIAALVFLILFYVKAFELSARIPKTAAVAQA
jgi:hypothetical protein